MWYKIDLGGYSVYTETPDGGGGRPDNWFDKLLKAIGAILILIPVTMIVLVTFKTCSSGEYGEHVQVERIDGATYYKFTGQGLKEGEMYIDEKMEGHEFYKKFKK